MMRANELMVGDWVSYKDHNWQVTTIREGIEATALKSSPIDEWVDPKWLSPIPITTEILEKNGFVLDEYGLYRLGKLGTVNGNEYISISFRTDDNNIYNARIIKGFNDMDLGKNFVHELQHALKLCGIEKEIIL